MMKDNADSDNAGGEAGNIYISSEQIIQEVQKFRCLYDPADPDNKDRDVVRDAWLSVTEAVVGDAWANLNTAERNEAVKEVKHRRWKNLRDNMRKCVVRGKSSSVESRNRRKRKPYRYYDQLTFLLETEPYKQINNTDDDDSTLQTDEQVKMPKSGPFRTSRLRKTRRSTKVISDLDDTSATHEADELSEASDSRPAVRSPRSKRKKNNNKPPSVIHAFKREENNRETEQSPVIVSYNSCPPEVAFSGHSSSVACMPDMRNPDWCFMLSLLPRVGALRSRDKLDFQIKVMEMLRGYDDS